MSFKNNNKNLLCFLDLHNVKKQTHNPTLCSVVPVCYQ